MHYSSNPLTPTYFYNSAKYKPDQKPKIDFKAKAYSHHISNILHKTSDHFILN